MKKLVFTVIFALLSLSIWAQKTDFYRNSLETAGGISYAPTRIHEHNGVTAFGKGAAASWRYTRYFDEKWGAFLQVELAGTSLNRESYFNKLDKLDGGKYKYYPFKISYICPGVVYDGIFLGGTYRYNMDRWSFRPYAGIGYADAYLRINKYYREDKNGDMEAVMTVPSEDEDASFITPVLAGKLGMQFKYRLTRHFHMGADIDMTAFACRHRYVSNIYKAEPRDPNLILYILTLGLLEEYSCTDLVERVYSTDIIPPTVSLKLTFGWDF